MRNAYSDTVRLAIVITLVSTATAGAAVLEVTHSPGAGQYGSVTAAIAAAADGDTIRIIDNSAPFEETVLIDTPDANGMFTLEGDPGLDPRPTIVGQGGTDIAGAVVTLGFGANYPTGCIIRNLILQSAPQAGPPAYSTLCMLRFNFNTTFENVEFDAGSPANIESAISQFWYHTNTFNNCTFKGGVYTIFSRSGEAVLNNCAIETAGTRTMLHGTTEGAMTMSFNDCTIAQAGGAWGVGGYDCTNQLTLNFNRCLFKATPAGGVDVPMVDVDGAGGTLPIINIDNCDFVKGPGADGILRGVLPRVDSTISVTDTIFYNLNPGVALWDAFGISEIGNDYCVFYDCELAAAGAGAVLGANTVLDGAPADLYVDAASGDYRVLATSNAATTSSGNSAETWAGSQGVEAAPPEYIIVASPTGAVQEGTMVTLTAPDGSNYVWEKDGVALADDGRISGSGSQTLTLDPAELPDGGVYICYFNDGITADAETLPYFLVVTAAPTEQVPAVGIGGLACCIAALSLLAARRAKRT